MKPSHFAHVLLAAGLASHGFGESVIQFPIATIINVTEGTGQVLISVLRTNDLDSVVSVDYASTNNTATPGIDYRDVAGTLTFAAGQTNLSISVPILNDSEIEAVESFQILLRNPSAGAILGSRTTALVRISDNDVGLQTEYASYRAAEDRQTVTIGVVRGDDGNFPITVDFTTMDGTAKAGADYVATSGTLTFAPSERIQAVKINLLNDGLKEGLETFLWAWSPG